MSRRRKAHKATNKRVQTFLDILADGNMKTLPDIRTALEKSGVFGSTVIQPHLGNVRNMAIALGADLEMTKDGKTLIGLTLKNPGKFSKVPVDVMVPKYIAPEMLPDTTEDVNVLAFNQKQRFGALAKMTRAVARGDCRSLIVSGPTGLGKSYGVMQELNCHVANGDIVVREVKGKVKATGIYKLLYEHQEKNNVVVFDDADIFSDEDALNLLKAATDTTETRRLSWMSEHNLRDEAEEKLPNQFEYKGGVICITNNDFDQMIARGHKLSPHLAAIASRAHYLDLDIKTIQAYLVRIDEVANAGMLADMHVGERDSKIILDYIHTHARDLRELSLRMVKKIADLRKMDPSDWESLVRTTCHRQK